MSRLATTSVSTRSVWRVVLVLLVIGLGYFWQNRSPQPAKPAPRLLESTQTSGLTAEELAEIPEFDPNYILHDESFSSTRVFNSAQSVQAYLKARRSVLATYTDQGASAAKWIWSASRGVTSSKDNVVPQLNPGLMLALIEKEQSLVSLTRYDTAADPEKRLRAATGYACPDNDTCDPKYYGFVVQVNSAAYQLQKNFNEAQSGQVTFATHRTIETLDEYEVTFANAATAAVYRYTPHVYWGNYNLWKIITANGWGVSSETYPLQILDQRNL